VPRGRRLPCRIVLLVWCQAETAEHGINFLHPGCSLCLLDDVHDAAVAARGQDDQALALQDVRGSPLMAEPAGDRANCLLIGWQTVGVAAQTIADPNRHFRRRQQFLKCRPRRLAGGEGMVRDQRRGGRGPHAELAPPVLGDRARQSFPAQVGRSRCVRKNIPHPAAASVSERCTWAITTRMAAGQRGQFWDGRRHRLHHGLHGAGGKKAPSAMP
jgi:hypothetical protein